MRTALRRSLPVLLFIFLLQSSVHVQAGARSSESNVAAPGGPADEVNPFVGTAPVPVVEGMKPGVFDTGNTYPGAALPFGMVQWSPDTETGFLKRRTSYFYGDDGIRGFSLNHLSGAGCQIMGDVLIQPIVQAVTASPATDASTYWAKFSHANEAASPGYYSVGFATESRRNWRLPRGPASGSSPSPRPRNPPSSSTWAAMPRSCTARLH